MKSAQELIHWLELGAGARWLRLASIVLVAAAVSLLVAWKQFRGPASEATLEQADVARQIARGQGVSTLVNYPQTAALLRQRGVTFDPAKPFPELHQAPLYSFVLAGGLWILPSRVRDALFAAPGEATEGYGADYFLLGVNLALLWLAAWLTFELGRQLFDARVGWVSALAVLLSLPLWQQTLAVNGTPLLMVLALAAFLVWRRVDVLIDARGENGAATAAVLVWIATLGFVCGWLFLAEYSAGALMLIALAYVATRLSRTARWMGAASLLAGFAVVSVPWVARNLAVSGSPVGLALHNVALKAGDPTAEPLSFRTTLSAEAPPLLLRKVANKTLTTLQECLKERLWSGGSMWLAAFFVAGWLYAFRGITTNRLRWVFTGAFLVLLLSQASLNSGESERLVVAWLAPLIIVFGVGFFFVLLGSNARLGSWPRSMAALLLLLQALPLVHDAFAPPPGLRFQYPPYFPTLLRGMKDELRMRDAEDRYGAMADIPAGVAWYGDLRVWAQPQRMRDFYAISLDQPIGELLLTPRTLNRPFFSELNGRAVVPGSMNSVTNRFGEWGEIYGGLVTGTMPREFPLRVPHRVAENLYVLLNRTLPPPRGK